MNYLKFKACRLRESLDPQHPQTAVMDQIEELFGAMTAIRNEIVQANLRLVVSIAKRYVNRANPDDLFEKCSDGNISLMRAAEKFDYARGNKFSTYASWAIMKNFARTIPTEQRHQSREQSGCADGLLGETIIDDRADPEASERAQMVRETKIELLLERLDEREQKIIRARFGLPPYKEPMTLKLVGAEMGVTKERVRQIEARALVKLRTAAREEGITLESVLGDLAVFSSD
jgi:RNA polymerase primary sigma factor/RNA polymerase sigma factor